MSEGALALVLHAHLPFVREPRHPRFLEETWLYEAVVECYLPLLERLDRLAADDVPCRLTLSLSPTLVAMLRDDLLMRRCATYLDRLCGLGAREVRRNAKDAQIEPLARFYRQRFRRCQSLFERRYGRDLVGAFARLERAGLLEIVTTAATHAFLPLLQTSPELVRAQLAVAVAEHLRVFGRRPAGLWLPECGFYPGVDGILAELGLAFTVVDAHGLRGAEPSPRDDVYAPLLTDAGVVVFGRDPESSEQVWSAESGYPGDPSYREFHRDIGFDLPRGAVREFVTPTGDRTATGFKYFRITGKTPDKRPYDPDRALARARVHAAHFVEGRRARLAEVAEHSAEAPVVVAPFDAELFGHWWFEGPDFLEAVVRDTARRGLTLATLGDLAGRPSILQVATPALSSWGAGGYAQVWLNPKNDWIAPALAVAGTRMIRLARECSTATGNRRRAATQAARELLLAQASDWPFLLNAGTFPEFAARQVRDHLECFDRLEREAWSGPVDRKYLAELEGRDSLFRALDVGVFA